MKRGISFAYLGKGEHMECPACGYAESKVVDSRPYMDNREIKRRRECLKCGHRFSTYERLEERPLLVIKQDGSSEPYDREKLMRGVLIACAKRPISPQTINQLIDEIETEARSFPRHEIPSKKLGEMALLRLSQLDDVAYIRFASVYKDFKSIDEFLSALKDIKK